MTDGSFIGLLKQLRQGERTADDVTDLAKYTKNVYGRIVAQGEETLQYLSSSKERKTVFLFGEDAIASLLLRKSPYDSLIELGFTPEYIHHKFVVEKSQCHIVLFKLPEGVRDKFDVLPATWDGVMKLVDKYYPLAADDCRRHLEVMKSKSCEEFEKEAGFKFLDSKISCSTSEGNAPPHYSYEYYCSLLDKGNRKAWQTRLFLYCELRLFELFTGNGCTLSISGKDRGYNSSGPLEYISPNVSLSYLKSLGIPIATVQLTLNVPNV